jgi:hypothetical protein
MLRLVASTTTKDVVQTDQLGSVSWEKRGTLSSAPATVLDEVRAKLNPLLSLKRGEPLATRGRSPSTVGTGLEDRDPPIGEIFPKTYSAPFAIGFHTMISPVRINVSALGGLPGQDGGFLAIHSPKALMTGGAIFA